MTKISFVFGLLLVLQGVGFYLGTRGTERESWTALIPAIFGVVIVICGIIAISEKKRKHAAHVAATAGLVGVLGGFGMSIPKFLKGDGEAGVAALAQLIMGLVCAVYLFFCIRSFVAARKARKKLEKMAKGA